MKNIAIIGSGISGLTSAYLLSQKHNVTVFEKDNYIGGHTATIDIELENESYSIDSGFIVFNNKTYPNFLKLLDQIGIKKQMSEMSFSVHNSETGLEYNGHNLNTLFSQRMNIFRPSFWRLISEILAFNKACRLAYDQQDYDPLMSLGEFIKKHDFSDFFAEHYILPMGAAIWSSSLDQMLDFQFEFFVKFFNNHGLLNVSDRPQWYVIPGGSRSYIKPLTKSFVDNIELNSDIVKVTREEGKIQIHFKDNLVREFDDVVFCCHSNQALSLLADATFEEQEILGDMPYSENNVVLHTDDSLLPKYRRTWASWNYQLSPNRSRPASVTYNMNILQGIKSKHTFCVSLNQHEYINPDKILRVFTYHHPIFNVKSLAAQKNRTRICGKNNTHFAGAYWYNGFHEDGVRSGVDIGKRFDCHL